SQGNLDYSADGMVTITDFNLLATNFGKTIDPPATQSLSTQTMQARSSDTITSNSTASDSTTLSPSSDDLLSDVGLV
ncbi:MAG TPA: hypothetical protein VL282_13960, partial [Tepidisphaeraceae bacterium]|nr:hypothetical protein [Tepidisphaeraceae bacterium]